MEEKEIIKSEKYDTLSFANIMLVLGFVCGIIIRFILNGWLVNWFCTLIAIITFAVFSLIGFLVHIAFSKIELTVTDKRIYGTTLFGKRVDLPLDSVSAVGTAWMKTINVTTSSGRISFSLMKNSDALHSEISKLLINRQGKTNETVIKQEIPQSNADELKKYKDLLDSGIITQDEFEAKKKQLLDL